MNAVTQTEAVALSIEPTVSYIGDLSAKGAFLAAFAKAQGAFEEIENNCTANVRPKDRTKAGYSFKYADLAEIIRKTRKALSDNGLVLSQTLRKDADNGVLMDTLLEHLGGCGKISTVSLPAPGTVDDDDFAATLSRFRRYMTQAMLNVAGADPQQPPPSGDDGGDFGDWPPGEFRDPDGASVTTPASTYNAPPADMPPRRQRPEAQGHLPSSASTSASPAPAAPARAIAEPQADDAQPASPGECAYLLNAAKRHGPGASVPALLQEIFGINLPADLAGLTKGQFRTLKQRIVSL